MKILINRKPVNGPWGGGNNFVKAMHKYLPKMGHQISNRLNQGPDIIFLMDPRYDNDCISINEAISYKRENPNVIIIQRINECDARKGTNHVDELLSKCSEYIDITIFVSNWMKDYHFKKGWKCKKNYVLINGVSGFYKKREKIKNGKINIVTHHWSDNYMKGFDIYEKIDDLLEDRKDITFTYIGRERGTFKNSNVVSPLFGEDLAKELGKYDLYVSASRFDPGPNHILESIACEIPTFSYFEGGGACEFTGSDFVFNDFEDLVEKIDKKEYNNNTTKVFTWKECMEKMNEDIFLKC
jgi:hypothetical protein